MSAGAAITLAPHVQTFLAFDFGLKRTGVASGNRLTRTATPQASITALGDARFAPIAERIQNGNPTRWWSAYLSTPMAHRMKTPFVRKNLRASCAGVSGSRSLRWTSATAPPRRTAWARKMPMPPLPA